MCGRLRVESRRRLGGHYGQRPAAASKSAGQRLARRPGLKLPASGRCAFALYHLFDGAYTNPEMKGPGRYDYRFLFGIPSKQSSAVWGLQWAGVFPDKEPSSVRVLWRCFARRVFVQRSLQTAGFIGFILFPSGGRCVQYICVCTKTCVYKSSYIRRQIDG